jgi:hypothetical protein
MSAGVMLHPPGNSFHPERGIGQGDTPSTLLFIAVFDILLTLLDDSGTGKVHAYADDLVHLAPTLETQQKQADLVCGFCAFTGLEISLKKVEAISVNHGNVHNTPFLVLRDWAWRPHRVQHLDDGYWIRYLGLFLDKDSCGRHYLAAKSKLQTMCHLLTRKLAPPAAKKLVYTLCIKSQVRYPAGLAPWTTSQYQALDKVPAELFRQIYGLRRTFPSALIYAPENVGGCGEARISDAAQLQKWKYLHTVAHLGSKSADVVSDLLLRAQQATPMDPTVYCTSLVEWGTRMGLSLSQAPYVALPQPLLDFFMCAAAPCPRRVYTDGSFTVDAPLLDVLSLSTPELTHAHGQAATGVYLPPSQGKEALALIVRTPSQVATDAYYQELLGTTISMLLSRHTPLLAFSDCSSAIRRTQQALYTLGPAVGHLQHGTLLQGLRLIASQERQPTTLT